MKKIYFISDIHLGFTQTKEEKKKQKNLYDFLDSIQKDANELYILGDLFDFWFEWYHVIPKYWFPILYHFRKMAERGIKINLIKGNHDFYLGKYLEKEIGINCLDESQDFLANGKRFFVSHGDGLAKNDWRYRFLKKIIRNPLAISIYKTFLPADFGAQLAKWTAHASRKLLKKKWAWSDEYFQFARKKFKKGYDFVILGHLHIPCRREEKGKIYINCGDWVTEYSYAAYNGHTLNLNHWKKKK